MKKRAILRTVVLCALILLILAAMCSYQSYQERVFSRIPEGPGDETAYRYCAFPFSFAGSFQQKIFLLVLVSLFVAVPSVKFRILGRICGVLLLLSSALILLILYPRQFGLFTPLTWGIVAALILLGLWAIFAFRKKPQAQSAEASDAAAK